MNSDPLCYRLKVEYNGYPSKTRRFHVASNMGPNHDYGVYNNNVATVERALLERYFTCKVGNTFQRALQVDKTAFKEQYLDEFRSRVVELVAPNLRIMSLKETLELYRGPKYRVYERAYVSLTRQSVRKKDAHLRAFAKFEKLLLSKAARIINPRDPRYNLCLGKYLKKAEKVYYAAINEVWQSCSDATIIKGFNVIESASILRAKWNRFANPVAVGLDAKKFDMHVSMAALTYEHSFYKMAFNYNKQLCSLLNWQLLNKGDRKSVV